MAPPGPHHCGGWLLSGGAPRPDPPQARDAPAKAAGVSDWSPPLPPYATKLTRLEQRQHVKENLAEYDDRRGVLTQIDQQPVEFALEEELREQIFEGRRDRRLQNLSIKLDPAQILALRKIATMRSIPYQTLIREWLADGIRRELRLTPR